jgi:hypothetical protein
MLLISRERYFREDLAADGSSGQQPAHGTNQAKHATPRCSTAEKHYVRRDALREELVRLLKSNAALPRRHTNIFRYNYCRDDSNKQKSGHPMLRHGARYQTGTTERTEFLNDSGRLTTCSHCSFRLPIWHSAYSALPFNFGHRRTSLKPDAR